MSAKTMAKTPRSASAHQFCARSWLMAWVRSKESEEPVVPVAMDVLLEKGRNDLD